MFMVTSLSLSARSYPNSIGRHLTGPVPCPCLFVWRHLAISFTPHPCLCCSTTSSCSSFSSALLALEAMVEHHIPLLLARLRASALHVGGILMAFALVGPPVAIHALVDLRVRILFLAVIEPFPAAVLALRKHVPGIELHSPFAAHS